MKEQNLINANLTWLGKILEVGIEEDIAFKYVYHNLVMLEL